MTHTLRGLYAVTPNLDNTEQLIEQTRRILQGGAKILQYRHKTASPALRLQQASALTRLAHEFKVPLIINDHVDLFEATDADGLHIGGDDGDVAQLRRHLGKNKILGVSCYGELERAQHASQHGADYVAFGGFYPSLVKQYPVTTTHDIISRAKAQISQPIVVIGGMTPDNAAPLVTQGADMVAVVSGLYSTLDPGAAAHRFALLFI